MKTAVSSSARLSGYTDLLDVNTARRQLKLALSVVTVIAVGVVSAALTLGAHPIDAKRDVVVLPTVSVFHAETNAIGKTRS